MFNMRHTYTKITIVRMSQTVPEQIDEELQWIGSSLGLFNLRDKDKSCYRLFITLLKYAKLQKPLSSDELAYISGLTRGTVVHHLNKMISSNIIKVTEGGYVLRAKNLLELIEQLKQDTVNMFDELKKVANNVDNKMN